MAVMLCRCGEELSNSRNPEIEYELHSQEEWVAVQKLAAEGETLLNRNWQVTAWKCPKCERMHIFRTHCDHPLRVYEVEESNDAPWGMPLFIPNGYPA